MNQSVLVDAQPVPLDLFLTEGILSTHEIVVIKQQQQQVFMSSASSSVAKKRKVEPPPPMALIEPPIHHPSGVTIDIFGIARGDRGCSCKEHKVCGAVLQEDSVVRIRHEQIIGDTGMEESALAAYWISDGIDCCRVGFLPRHLLKDWQVYNGRIAQVVDIYEGSESPAKKRKNVRNYGCCEAVLIDIHRTWEMESDGERDSENSSDM